ncbi:MAG: response regulator [Kiritimatiellae bacterium]|nr:response regulator [Kiritimatiellia bacterium]
MLDAIDRKHSEAITSNERTRALLAANPDLIFVFDRFGNILDAGTPGDERMALLFPGSVEGRNIRQVEGVRPEVAASLIEHLADAIDSGRIQLFEYSMKKPSGAMFWAEARIVRMSSDRALVIVRDITAKRNAQRERARLEEKMTRVQKVEILGVLAGGVAHDYNNILTAMLAHVEIVMREALSPAGREAVESIRHAMLRATALTRQMLAYTGQGTFKFQLTDLNRLLQDLVRLMRRSLSRQAEIDIALGEGVPLVEADGTQIWQVAMNLLLNASDALAGSVGKIRLHTAHVTPTAAELDAYLALTPLKPGDYAMIEISDTGHGMDARTIERIFDPFFTTKAVGRGLGLSAVLGIVRAHNGGINVTSTPGQGTCFRVLLPAARNSEGELLFELETPTASAFATRRIPIDAAPPVSTDAERRLVLVADDEPDIRQLVQMVLKANGYNAILASCGAEAVSLLARHRNETDIALIDMAMPGMNGVETIDALRALEPRLPVIMMSGYGEIGLSTPGVATHLNGYLAKPFSGAELLAVIEKGLAAVAHDQAAATDEQSRGEG